MNIHIDYANRQPSPFKRFMWKVDEYFCRIRRALLAAGEW